MRQVARRTEHDLARPERVAAAQELGRGERCGGRTAGAGRDHIDPPALDAKARDDLIRHGTGLDDDAMGPARCQAQHRRRSRPCQRREQLRQRPVLEIVNRHDAAERSPRRREVRRGVHELEARAPRRAGDEHELAERPLQATARRDRERDHAHALAQLRGQLGARVAPDERDELQRRIVREHRGHELAQVGLPPTGLAGHEVDEVEADAHQRRRRLTVWERPAVRAPQAGRRAVRPAGRAACSGR